VLSLIIHGATLGREGRSFSPVPLFRLCPWAMVAAVCGSIVLVLFGGKMVYVLMMGGFSAVIGAILVPLIIIVPPNMVEVEGVDSSFDVEDKQAIEVEIDNDAGVSGDIVANQENLQES
jgi:hypothetical protein